MKIKYKACDRKENMNNAPFYSDEKVESIMSSPADESKEALISTKQLSPRSHKPRGPTGTGLLNSFTPCFQYLLSTVKCSNY